MYGLYLTRKKLGLEKVWCGFESGWHCWLITFEKRWDTMRKMTKIGIDSGSFGFRYRHKYFHHDFNSLQSPQGT